LLQGVRYNANFMTTYSLVLRGKSGIRRHIRTDHPLERLAAIRK
jgi:fructose-1,6-bisphosphatase/sedoheptulose 1,7-bisphosphatase-like protein